MKKVLWLLRREISDKEAKELTKVLEDTQIELIKGQMKWNINSWRGSNTVQNQVVELGDQGFDVIISDHFPSQVWFAFINYADNGYWYGVSILAPIYDENGNFVTFEGYGEHYHYVVERM